MQHHIQSDHNKQMNEQTNTDDWVELHSAQLNKRLSEPSAKHFGMKRILHKISRIWSENSFDLFRSRSN